MSYFRRRFHKVKDTAHSKIQIVIKQLCLLLKKMGKKVDEYLLMVAALFYTVVLCLTGLVFPTLPVSKSLEIDSYFSYLSVSSITVYAILKSLPSKEKQQNASNKRIARILVSFIIMYVVLYWGFNRIFGNAEGFSAIGNACTILGLASAFFEIFSEEYSSHRSQKKE